MKYVKENGYPIEIKYYQQVKDSRFPNEYSEIRKERFFIFNYCLGYELKNRKHQRRKGETHHVTSICLL